MLGRELFLRIRHNLNLVTGFCQNILCVCLLCLNYDSIHSTKFKGTFLYVRFLYVFCCLQCFSSRCQYLRSIYSHFEQSPPLTLKLYARQITSSVSTEWGESGGGDCSWTSQEPGRGGGPEKNLTGENYGIPGGTFRSGSRLVCLTQPRHRQPVNTFTPSRNVVLFFLLL